MKNTTFKGERGYSMSTKFSNKTLNLISKLIGAGLGARVYIQTDNVPSKEIFKPYDRTQKIKPTQLFGKGAPIIYLSDSE